MINQWHYYPALQVNTDYTRFTTYSTMCSLRQAVNPHKIQNNVGVQPSSVSHLHRFHHMKVGHILVSKLGMLGQVDIFLGHHDSLLEEELIDSNAILLRHQHLCKVTCWVLFSASASQTAYNSLHYDSILAG